MSNVFKDAPKIEIPPRPRRKVKKPMECWVNFYSDGGSNTHQTKEEADNYTSKFRSRIGEAVHFVHEFEVEE